MTARWSSSGGRLPKIAREFWVEPRVAPFMYDGRYPVAESIRRLLVASVETGNPIIWE